MKRKNKAQCRKEYQENFELFQRLLEAAKGDIGALLDQNNIDTISILGRVKKFDSYYKKAEDGMSRDAFSDPIHEIQDIIGVRSVLIFIDDLEKIPDLLSPTFEIIETERKGSNNAENTFGYESDHYILKYKKVSGPRYKDLMNLKFELQVRTPLMDAWASLSHKIDYKTDAAIPTKLKRVFFGLSGMFAVADKTFQDLKNASKQNQEKIADQVSIEKLLDLEINLDTLKAYVDLKFADKTYPKTDDNDYSEFIEEIKKIGGYATIKDIDNAIETTLPTLAKIENYIGDESQIEGKRLVQVGALRAIFDLYDDEYFKRTESFSTSNWARTIKQTRSSIERKKR